MPYDTNNIFARILRGELPKVAVYEDEHTLAFMDIGHVNPGHTLVVVKQHAANVFELEETQAEAIARAIARISRALKKTFEPEGLSIYQANGRAAGQTVFHYHVHLLPRHQGDGMELVWPVKNPPRERLEEYAARIRAALG